jgi:hypothetical protein
LLSGKTMWKEQRNRLREQIRDWYQGKYVPHTNDPNSSLVFTGGNYDKSLSAKTVTVLFKFWLQYWQWIISMFFVTMGTIIVLSAFLKK